MEFQEHCQCRQFLTAVSHISFYLFHAFGHGGYGYLKKQTFNLIRNYHAHAFNLKTTHLQQQHQHLNMCECEHLCFGHLTG